MPDMRLPIGYALAYPDRIATPFGAMDWSEPRTLEFEPPDRATFRCLDLAYQAGRAGRTAPAWLSAANEVAVDAFLEGRIGWSAIADVVEAALATWDQSDADSLDAVLAADAGGRASASRLLASGAFDRSAGA
jgi:1-deoxy-D-xylulose-5-phosphate reductoisomerase